MTASTQNSTAAGQQPAQEMPLPAAEVYKGLSICKGRPEGEADIHKRSFTSMLGPLTPPSLMISARRPQTPTAPFSAIASGDNRLSKAMATSSSALREDRASCSVARKATPFQASRYWSAGDFTAPATGDFGWRRYPTKLREQCDATHQHGTLRFNLLRVALGDRS